MGLIFYLFTLSFNIETVNLVSFNQGGNMSIFISLILQANYNM